MLYRTFWLGLVILLAPQFSWAHGENIKGPHGGEIRMPGNFHTEVVEDQKGFRVYLLDFDFTNPTIKDSSVKVVLKTNEAVTELSCTPDRDYFRCLKNGSSRSPSSTAVSSEIELIAVRDRAAGGKVSYKLPLKFNSAKGPKRVSR